ncbi:MAG: hypothetical protein NVSMB1_00440 [Polyangiales bacterium]
MVNVLEAQQPRAKMGLRASAHGDSFRRIMVSPRHVMNRALCFGDALLGRRSKRRRPEQTCVPKAPED